MSWAVRPVDPAVAYPDARGLNPREVTQPGTSGEIANTLARAPVERERQPPAVSNRRDSAIARVCLDGDRFSLVAPPAAAGTLAPMTAPTFSVVMPAYNTASLI